MTTTEDEKHDEIRPALPVPRRLGIGVLVLRLFVLEEQMIIDFGGSHGHTNQS